MGTNLVTFENLDFADLTRNSEPCDPHNPNTRTPMTYVTEGPYGRSVIADTSSWLCASGVHLAQVGQQIQQSRTISPRFGLLTPYHGDVVDNYQEAIIGYHANILSHYKNLPDPGLDESQAYRIEAASHRVLLSGSRLLGGVYFKQEADGLKGDIFFALSLAKSIPLEVAKIEIARRSFTAQELAAIFGRATKETAVPPEQDRNHLKLVAPSVAAAAA